MDVIHFLTTVGLAGLGIVCLLALVFIALMVAIYTVVNFIVLPVASVAVRFIDAEDRRIYAAYQERRLKPSVHDEAA